MKIQGPGATKATSSTKKASKAKGAKGEFARALNELGGGGDAASDAAGVGPVGAVDALLSIQQVDDATSGGGNAQAQAWGEDLLEKLEEIRNGLLLGRIPPDRLEQLAESVRNRKARATDPRLADILSEIEVRALVELAKYQRAMR